MAISYDDPRTQPKQTPTPKPKPKGVIYGGAQDSDLITPAAAEVSKVRSANERLVQLVPVPNVLESPERGGGR